MNMFKTVLCVCFLLLNSQANAQHFDCNRMDNKILAKLDKLNRISQTSSDFELVKKEEKAKEDYAAQLWKKGKKQEAMCVLTSIPNYYISKYKLGELHYISKEYDKAFELFTQSLDSQGYDGYNSNKSLYYLGELYEKGLGTKKDEKQAVRHYLMSAYSGDKKAMLKLSELYQQGILVDKDEIHGKFWLQTYYNTLHYYDKQPQKTAIKIDKNLISKENKPHWVIMPLPLNQSRNYIFYFDVNSLKFRDENNLATAKVRFNFNAPYANEKLNSFDEDVDTGMVIFEFTYECKNKKIKSIGTIYRNGQEMGKKDTSEEDYKASPHKAPIDFLFEDLCQ